MKKLRQKQIDVAEPEILPDTGKGTTDMLAHQLGYDRARETMVKLPLALKLVGYTLHSEGAGMFCKKYAVFEIFCVQGTDITWTIFRRYSQLAELDTKLKKIGILPKSDTTLPAKTGVKRQNDDESVLDRMAGIQTYLDKIISQMPYKATEAVYNVIMPVQIGDIKPKT